MVHQSPVAATVLITPEVIKNEEDKAEIAEHVKAMTGRSTVEVVAVRKVLDGNGRTISFEVDIR
jgi:hypothetical protein